MRTLDERSDYYPEQTTLDYSSTISDDFFGK
jgi:hypothetical protein